jgi:hypothetical protein
MQGSARASNDAARKPSPDMSLTVACCGCEIGAAPQRKN